MDRNQTKAGIELCERANLAENSRYISYRPYKILPCIQQFPAFGFLDGACILPMHEFEVTLRYRSVAGRIAVAAEVWDARSTFAVCGSWDVVSGSECGLFVERARKRSATAADARRYVN